MPLVIAIFGKSCVGKSVVAKELATILKLPVRHCGEIIKARAKELGVDVGALPVVEHRAIDDETRALTKISSNGMMIEGSFLDAVLENVPNVLFVHLICEDSERERRFIQRLNGQASPNDLRLRDASDMALRESLYKSSSKTYNLLIIDTTNFEIDEVVQRIIDQINTKV